MPPHRLRQQDIAAAASRLFHRRNDFARFLPVYENAAIDTRYSCVPLSWYEKPSTLSERNALYLKHALNLLEKAAGGALKRAQRTCDDIDGIVVVSSSGIATPSLDALLMERLKLKRNIERLPVFGLGCAGGVIGLARTAQLAQGRHRNAIYTSWSNYAGLISFIPIAPRAISSQPPCLRMAPPPRSRKLEDLKK